MTVVNGKELLISAPIKDMLLTKERSHGVSHGLSEAGYDIRIKQDICFMPLAGVTHKAPKILIDNEVIDGRFVIASTVDEFQLPDDLVGVVHDKSTWARQGLSVFNTVLEPGWKGFLTLELVFHGEHELFIPAGSGIAQVIFNRVEVPASYDGKYQHQLDMPVESIWESPE